MKSIILILACIVLAIPAGAQTISDIEGNVYNTITLGNQVWMKENLKTGKYRDGSPLNTDWTQVPYVGTASDYAHVHLYDSIYGKLYNWYAVGDARKICPVGFHVPNNTEWIELRTFLGGAAVAGSKMKEAGTSNWQSPNTGADNSSGFSARPSGNCANATFMGLGTGAGWWSTTMDTPTGYYYGFGVDYNSTALGSGMTIKSYGNAVRCVGDLAATSIENIPDIPAVFVFPNPFSDQLSFSTSNNDVLKITLYDYLSRPILERTFANNMIINTEPLAGGIYFYELRNSKGKIKTGKIVKE